MSQQRGFALGDYNEVADRIVEFRSKYPDGSFQPADAAEPFRVVTIGEQTFIVVVAAAYRNADDARPGIGMAWEPFPGKTQFTRDSELQNAETSAWGRAIVAALAADTKKGVASADEVRNRREAQQGSYRDGTEGGGTVGDLATAKQVGMLQGLIRKTIDPDGAMDKESYRAAALDWIAQNLGGLKIASSKELTKAQASQLIDVLQRSAA